MNIQQHIGIFLSLLILLLLKETFNWAKNNKFEPIPVIGVTTLLFMYFEAFYWIIKLLIL